MPKKFDMIPTHSLSCCRSYLLLSVDAAVRCLFAKPPRESTITRLQLKLYLVSIFPSDIGPLVGVVIDRVNLLKDLHLSFLDELRPCDSSDLHMLPTACLRHACLF